MNGKLILTILILILLALIGIFLPKVINAQGSVYKFGTTVHVDQSDTLTGNVLTAGEVVEMTGYIDNDLFAASRHLLISGQITDDAFLAGRAATFSGYVGDMLLIAGETVTIDGEIQGDLFAAGREVRIAENARIHGNAAIAGKNISNEGGTVSGWLRVAGERVHLNGLVSNYVEIYSSRVEFGPEYEARYSTTITSEKAIHRENLGNIPENLNLVVEEPDIWKTVLFQLWFFTSLLITGLILIRIFRDTVADIHKFSTERFWKNTGVGFVTITGIPVATGILALLILTLPLAGLLAISFGVALFFSYLLVALILGVTGIAYFTGSVERSTYYWGLALGMLIIAVLVNLPFIGWLFHVLFILFGLGSITYYVWMMSRPQPKLQEDL